MPFREEFNNVYLGLIKPSLEAAGYEVTRADTQLNQRNIMSDVVKGIFEADLIIADLTDLNTNVFYELGIAHTLPKKTILLTQNFDEIPFDLRSYRIITYSTAFDKADELKKNLLNIGKKAITDEIIFGNPVTDFLPLQELRTITSEDDKSEIDEKIVWTADYEDILLIEKNLLNEISNYLNTYLFDIIDISEKIMQNIEIKKIYEDEMRIKRMRLIFSINYDDFVDTFYVFEDNAGKLIGDIKYGDSRQQEQIIEYYNSLEEYNDLKNIIITELNVIKGRLKIIKDKCAFIKKEEKENIMNVINMNSQKINNMATIMDRIDKILKRITEAMKENTN